MDVKDWLRVHWDRALAWTLVTGGAVVLLLGWDGVASTPFPAEQMSSLVSGGIGGGLLIVVGAALLVSADLRDEWHKLDRIERLLRDGAAVADEPEPARAETGSNGSNGTDRAVTPLRRRTPDDRLRATGS